MLVLMGMLAGCGSITTTEETTFSADGKSVQKITKVTKDSMNWPLRGKGFSMRSNGFIGEITTAVDPSTGTMLPSIRIGKAGTDMDDIPMADMDAMFAELVARGKLPENFVNYSETLNLDKSLWGAELANGYYNRKGSGTMVAEPAVKINYNLQGTAPALTQNTNIGAKTVVAESLGPTTNSPMSDGPQSAILESSKNTLGSKSAASGIDINDITDQAKDWISKPENQAQAKSWLSQAWSWISGLF
jgi:hypothetical protein